MDSVEILSRNRAFFVVVYLTDLSLEPWVSLTSWLRRIAVEAAAAVTDEGDEVRELLHQLQVLTCRRQASKLHQRPPRPRPRDYR